MSELVKDLRVCSVKRCSDRVSLLPEFSYTQWSDAWRKAQANKFVVKTPEGEGDAEMVFREASMFNHSCGPNAGIDFPLPGRIMVTAVEDICMGEEVCIDYWPGGGNPGEAFTCECDACN